LADISQVPDASYAQVTKNDHYNTTKQAKILQGAKSKTQYVSEDNGLFVCFNHTVFTLIRV
jgi:molybdopterin-biosynthesis enzyme MoeA-like protein